MSLAKKLNDLAKRGPWGYRFWRDRLRRRYEKVFTTPPIAPDMFAEFPEADELRSNYQNLRTEALAICAEHDLPGFHEFMPEQRTLYEFDNIPWQILTLRAYGLDYPENLALMPEMAAFLKKHENVVSASVSVFPPGKHLRAHRGVFKGVWRYHLAYLAADLGEGKTACELEIDGQTVYLKEGEDLLWDDTFWHAAFNRSTSPRVVLLLDVLRNNHTPYLAFCTRRRRRISAFSWRSLISPRSRSSIWVFAMR